MSVDNFSLCACVLAFICVLGVGDCLDCYHCNVTTSLTNNEDPCKGLATLQKCQDPAVCLAAKYAYHDPSLPITTTTMKTCYPNLGGNECQIFLQNIRTTNAATAKIDFSESCVTCSENGCNHEPGNTMWPERPETTTKKSSASLVSPLLIISLFLWTAAKFV